ncbi:hypothetical protein HGRIS_004298 [Hohenbuehelia grisea]|uniref:Uncharacterized protein n=1 Tax=Hohenbuehelia grisea TaxID=104357 RepID=A0ABR3IPC3_9AGAR
MAKKRDQLAWAKIYGSCYVRPPTIVSDVSRQVDQLRSEPHLEADEGYAYWPRCHPQLAIPSCRYLI